LNFGRPRNDITGNDGNQYPVESLWSTTSPVAPATAPKQATTFRSPA